jgi:hypothetical protein
MDVTTAMEAAGVTREQLGQTVRRVWVGWAQDQRNPKESWLKPWAELTQDEKEADMRIGQVLFGVGWRAALNYTDDGESP